MDENIKQINNTKNFFTKNKQFFYLYLTILFLIGIFYLVAFLFLDNKSHELDFPNSTINNEKLVIINFENNHKDYFTLFFHNNNNQLIVGKFSKAKILTNKCEIKPLFYEYNLNVQTIPVINHKKEVVDHLYQIVDECIIDNIEPK